MGYPPYGPADYGHLRPVDDLTDSASHRLMLGTRVRLYVHAAAQPDHVDAGLLTIRDVATWDELVQRIQRGMPIEILAPRRRILGPGVVLHAEVLTDPGEEGA